MKKRSGIWAFWGFAVTSLLGTLLHFLYDLTGRSSIAALFSGVNESTWEHMKLLFFPMLLFAIIEYFFFKEMANVWYTNLCSVLWGLTLIPVLFYTYNGVIGRSPDVVNIAIFFISAACAYIYAARRTERKKLCAGCEKLSFIILCIIGAMFMIFTFAPPMLNIFKDPISGTYGI